MPLIYPTALVPNTPEDTNDLNSILNAINTWANGNIDTDDILDNAIETAKIADGNVTDAKLASPSNGVYRHLLHGRATLLGAGASTYMLGTNQDTNGPAASGGNLLGSAKYPFDPASFYLASSDFAVNGKTTKLHIRADVLVNATAPAVNLVVGLYPVTAVAGASASLNITLGTVVPGSTATFTAPSASGSAPAVSGDFDLPSDGMYALGVAVSGSQAANSVVQLAAALRVRNVD